MTGDDKERRRKIIKKLKEDCDAKEA